MPLSGYLGIAILVLLVSLAGSGWLLKQSYETNGGLVAAQENNAKQLEKAAVRVEELLQKQNELQLGLLELGHANSLIQQERDIATSRLDKWRSSLDQRTLLKPEVTRRAARRAIRVRQCKLWETTGGVGPCPK